MKKLIIYSTLIACVMMQTLSFAAGNPRGHKYYVKHSKHHKAHKVHRPHGILDETYR